MNKSGAKKGQRGAPKVPVSAAPVLTAEAQEIRALLRRVPDGTKAALAALKARPADARERVLSELTRTLGREVLPLLGTAGKGSDEGLAVSAVRVLPILGSRAAADLLTEIYAAFPDSDRAAAARTGAGSLAARGIRVGIPEETSISSEPVLSLRETSVCSPDGVGSASVVARFQDRYGVWHGLFVLWNDQAGIKDGFFRPVSRNEWYKSIAGLSQGEDVWVTCPKEYAQQLVQRFRMLNEETGFPVENHLADWDRLIGPPPANYSPPNPADVLVGVDEETRERLLAASMELARHKDTRVWFFEVADCKDVVADYASFQFRHRSVEPDEEARSEMLRKLAEAADPFITGEEGLRLSRRLDDLVVILTLRDGSSRSAQQARVVAEAIRAGRPAIDTPFVLGMMQRTVMAGYRMLVRGEDPEKHRYRPMRKPR